MRIAMDSGGTFTDCVFVRGGQLHIIKVASRPDAPAEAIAEAVQQALAQHPEAAEPLDLVCGTTVGTNALLERRGGRVALVTTAGFEDVLEIGRQARPELYNLKVQRAEPLTPASRRFGARERLSADGSVVQSLTAIEISRIARLVSRAGPDAIAICFLFSFRNSIHEKRLAKKLRAAGFAVSVSHEILPEFREYERTSTTVINAYLTPVMSGYLRKTMQRVATIESKNHLNQSRRHLPNAIRQSSVRIMQSNGGIISAEQAAREPVRTILSGPAGGVIGAARAAALAGIEKSISFDMGGTSTDVALLGGTLRTTTEAIVAGMPVAVPMLEIHTVGAGGGSLARFDAGGALRVGPQSAGATPGPICYGRGTQPTVTDAHAVLGHLGTAGLLGGAFALDIPRARELMNQQLHSAHVGFRTVEHFAQGIIAVANSVMEKAIRVISVARGHDTRDYSLIAFGGAGGLHASDLAEALEMRQVLIPMFPGGLSALGILQSDVVKELSRTVLIAADESAIGERNLKKLFAPLAAEAANVLTSEGFARNQMTLAMSLDMRYVGQAYELNIPLRGNIVEVFHLAHEQRYGYHDQTKKIEIVNIRCRATGLTEKSPITKIPARKRNDGALSALPSEIFFDGKLRQANLYRREEFRAQDTFRGPAVLLEYSGTTIVPPGWQGNVDTYGQLLLWRGHR
jgi:N-methylhydantoinase A